MQVRFVSSKRAEHKTGEGWENVKKLYVVTQCRMIKEYIFQVAFFNECKYCVAMN